MGEGIYILPTLSPLTKTDPREERANYNTPANTNKNFELERRLIKVTLSTLQVSR